VAPRRGSRRGVRRGGRGRGPGGQMLAVLVALLLAVPAAVLGLSYLGVFATIGEWVAPTGARVSLSVSPDPGSIDIADAAWGRAPSALTFTASAGGGRGLPPPEKDQEPPPACPDLTGSPLRPRPPCCSGSRPSRPPG